MSVTTRTSARLARTGANDGLHRAGIALRGLVESGFLSAASEH